MNSTKFNWILLILFCVLTVIFCIGLSDHHPGEWRQN